MSLLSKREVFNSHTGKIDVYKKQANARIVRITGDFDHLILSLEGLEKVFDPYKDNIEYELDKISLVNGQAWIIRKISGNARITIHSACSYQNFEVFI